MNNPIGGTFLGLEPGMELNNRYEIVSLRGQGAFGAVYKAVDRGLDEPRSVAVKLIHPMVVNDARAFKRIKREVAIAREINHTNVVGVWDLVEWRDFTFIVMQNIDGPNLGDFLAEQEDERLPLDGALKYLRDMASGLDYLHNLNPPIIHRDLKPSNVLIAKETDQAIITDFGLAREIKDTMSHLSAADTSGSPPYMAPEIWNNDPPTAQCDIYALGVMAFEMISGDLPFRGPDYGYQHRSIAPKPIEVIGDDHNACILKALEKDPSKRYGCAGAFVDALAGSARPKPIRCPVCGEVEDIERFDCPVCGKKNLCESHRAAEGVCSQCESAITDKMQGENEDKRGKEKTTNGERLRRPNKPLLWQNVLLIGVGWAVAAIIGCFLTGYGDPGSHPFESFTIIWLILGLVTVLVLMRVTSLFSLKPFLALCTGWAGGTGIFFLNAALSYYIGLYYVPDNITVAVGGGVGGVFIGLVLSNITKRLPKRKIFIIGVSWATALEICWLLVNRTHWTIWPIVFAIGGSIGGCITLWAIRQARESR